MFIVDLQLRAGARKNKVCWYKKIFGLHKGRCRKCHYFQFIEVKLDEIIIYVRK